MEAFPFICKRADVHLHILDASDAFSARVTPSSEYMQDKKSVNANIVMHEFSIVKFNSKTIRELAFLPEKLHKMFSEMVKYFKYRSKFV